MLQYKCTIFRENKCPFMQVKNWRSVLPEDGRLVLKHNGDTPLVFELINPVHLAAGINDVLCYMIVQSSETVRWTSSISLVEIIN